MNKNLSLVELFKFVFAVLIVFLHINTSGTEMFILMQYISRLGVPFFFATTGFLLVT